jgi:hypothetical protein
MSTRSSSPPDGQIPDTAPPETTAPDTGKPALSLDANPKSISAEEIHRALVTAHRIGARARLRFIRGLLALHRTGLYVKLGFSTTAHYASSEFGYQKTEVYESLRVAEALEGLPQCTEAFERGGLSWSALKEVTRVATAETEAEWLEFAAKKTFEELRAEVLDARRKNRKVPRTNGYGLPHLRVKITLDLEPEEHALLEKAVEKVAAELGGSLEGESLRPHQALLYLAERALEEPVDASGDTPGPRSSPPFTVLYRVCPDCRATHVATSKGYVEVSEEAATRVEGEARKVEIPLEEETTVEEKMPASPQPTDTGPLAKDAPNTPSLTRRVVLRDGACCANPHCGRRQNLHAHHIRFRSQGGRTALTNEVLVCDRCHACIHLGFLRLEGNPADGLRWTPAVRSLDPTHAEAARLEAELANVPVVVARGGPAIPEFRNSGIQESPISPGPVDASYGPVRALEHLGHDRAAALSLASRAREERIRRNPGSEPDENTVFNLAVRLGRARPPVPQTAAASP